MQRIPSNEGAAAAAGRFRAARPLPSRDVRAFGTAVTALVSCALLCWSAPAPAQQLERSIRHPWTLYVFVSTTMPHQGLVELAREASQAQASMVFRGFPGSSFDLGGEQRLIAQLNAECCGVDAGSAQSQAGSSTSSRAAARAVPAWSIDPALYRRFEVSVVPTFVLAGTGAAGDQAFTKVAGDMALASALKYFAQGSAIPALRQAAVSIYQSAYGGRQ